MTDPGSDPTPEPAADAAPDYAAGDPSGPSRRSLLLGGSAALGSLAVPAVIAGPAQAGGRDTADGLRLTHGTVTGDVTATTAQVWIRGSGPGRAKLVYGIDADRVRKGGDRHTRSVRLDPARDHTAQFALEGLEPGTRYHYSVRLQDHGKPVQGPLASFTTAPADDDARDVLFTWGGDVGQGLRNPPPFPAFSAMLAQDPAFFIFNGDTIYADATTKVGGAAKTLPQYWAKYKQNREDGHFQALASRVPLVVNWDDHEVANDFRGPEEPLMPIGRQAFHEYWPLSVGPERIYRSLRWGREVEVFVLDGRQYADPLDAPDGPDKSLLGREQRDWLLDGVTRSTATWKVLVTSSPLSILRSAQGPQDDYVSFEHELRLILDAFRDAGVTNFVWLTADVHWGQAIEYPERGFWEFVGSPIGANPRVAPRPLSPTFGPQERFLRLKQRLYGSVFADASAGSLRVRLHDEGGKDIYEVTIPGA